MARKETGEATFHMCEEQQAAKQTGSGGPAHFIIVFEKDFLSKVNRVGIFKDSLYLIPGCI